MTYDLLVIGGGASGLIAAISAARQGLKVLILEHNEKPGRKILATGNGKCNFTNLYQGPETFRSDNIDFPNSIIEKFNVSKTIEFFEELGVYHKNKNGYLYPYSEQASSVVNVLVMECHRLNIMIKYGIHINKIISPYFTIKTNEETYYAKKTILATGGCSSPKLGSDGSGYLLAKNLGHNIIKPLPALVQLVSSDNYCKALAGIRLNAEIKVYINNEFIILEEGEILFTNYGISGIPILQVSRYATKALDENKDIYIKINLMNNMSKDDLIEMLKKRIINSRNKNIEEMLIGLFNDKLIPILLNKSKISKEKSTSEFNILDIENLAREIQNFQMNIIDHNSFENSQVTAGGVDTREISNKTMESLKVKGLYFAGEIVDVDGTCGGYNLQWAWSSGYIAGFNAAI
ncbi:MAG TPA: NAD(P)/FAD-dependent oxidoreductase [Clostridiales bacterium]|nr:NAD(P)/FAD-dependent oxidoreductase [Clostridiales bacterium]